MNAPGFPEAIWFKLRGYGRGLKLGIVARFGLGRWDIADRGKDASVIEPVHPFEGGEFHCSCVAPGPPAMNDLGFEQAVDRLGERIIVGIADAADRWLDPCLGQTFGVSNGDVLGGFKWSSQHLGEEGWDGRSASVGSRVAEQAAFTGTTSGSAAGAPAAVLGIDCGRSVERGRGDWRERIWAGRSTVVSKGRRYATDDTCAISEAAVWAIPVVCRAGGACNPACPGCGGAADRAAYGAVGINDLARASPQCGDAQWRTGLSGEHCAVAF